MDINGDGILDLISGGFNTQENLGNSSSYVLQGGSDKLMFGNVESLHQASVSQSCTKPCFADLNNDGVVDIIYGNKKGLFYQFDGRKADKRITFSKELVKLQHADGTNLSIDGGYSSPHFVDWDSDGDLDLLSGSRKGAVIYFENKGTTKKPLWSKPVTWVNGLKASKDTSNLSPYLISDKGPATRSQYVTSITTTDYNRDGKLDLVIGDLSTQHNSNLNEYLNTNNMGNVWVMLQK